MIKADCHRAKRRGAARAAGFFCALIGYDQGGLLQVRRISADARARMLQVKKSA
jgi:hypothetical protein